MSANYFLDTNIFICSFDETSPTKCQRSRQLINMALQTEQGMISVQVMQEFLNAATRKFPVPLTLQDSITYLHKVLNPLCQVYPNAELIEKGLSVKAETGYSFYDSLILAAAITGNCTILYSEDMQHGQTVHGVQIINPYVVNPA
jgi:predicted nucleic acid-binding protein